jgi:hypothetical protein
MTKCDFYGIWWVFMEIYWDLTNKNRTLLGFTSGNSLQFANWKLPPISFDNLPIENDNFHCYVGFAQGECEPILGNTTSCMHYTYYACLWLNGMVFS